MAAKKNARVSAPERLRRAALALPGVEEGTSCKNAAFKAGGKAFLYLGEGAADYKLMLKLADSAAEAADLAEAQPEHYAINAHGWLTVRFGAAKGPAARLLDRWLLESYRALAPKVLREELDG